MRFDIVTIFPQFFDVLDVSLVGKARRSGRIDARVHDLRDWADGKHKAVDDTPAGGGAGMVMMPSVWGDAIDAVFADDEHPRMVLAIPTPAGRPLTQKMVEDLASADQIVIACGRYEGIDYRVADHYRDEGVEVLEFSLGDYVLNGGEVAALALIEATSRLVDGVVGNPESLTEESHGASGLLEYPVYTAPTAWRGQEVPPVLLSGDHGKIARYRRDEALRRTLRVRPDMILDRTGDPATEWSTRDREVLAGEGLALVPKKAQLTFHRGTVADLPAVSRLATDLFPLACPAGTEQEEIDQFTSTYLSVSALTANLVDEGARMCFVTARSEGGADEQLVGYTLLFPNVPEDLVAEAPAAEGGIYLSKIYVDGSWHGSGIAGALLQYALEDAEQAWHPSKVVLGTNRANKGASRFYRRHGFTRAGTRTFDVGGKQHLDYVFVRDLAANPIT